MRRKWQVLLCGMLLAAALVVPAAASAQAPQPKIVGGSTASISTYPWQTALIFNPAKVGGRELFCGGSLLTSHIVITAGHCVANSDPDCAGPLGCLLSGDPGGDHTAKLDPNDVDAILGYSNWQTAPSSALQQPIGVYLDPNFHLSGSDSVPNSDAAFLVLGSPQTQPSIKIAGPGEGALWDPGSAADISGWGSTSDGSAPVGDLRAASVTINSNNTCSGAYPGDFDGSTMICAGNPSGGVDTCSGDSGGPLEAPLLGGGYRLVGLTGWGIGCGQASHPGVYTRVADTTMASRIQSDVNTLDATYGLPPEPIFGSGGLPLGATPPSSKTTKGPSANKQKCKRIHSKQKRKRCFKKLKRKAPKKK
jgi:trypsin